LINRNGQSAHGLAATLFPNYLALDVAIRERAAGDHAVQRGVYVAFELVTVGVMELDKQAAAAGFLLRPAQTGPRCFARLLLILSR
jgi:hypothetical protein